MAQGLEVFDGVGNRTFSVTDRITRFLGAVWSGADSGSINHAGLATGAPWFYLLPRSQNVGGTEPFIEISGATLSWYWSLPPSAAQRVGVTIVYGVY